MIDFSNPADMHGLTTQIQRRVNQLLRDYSPRLSLRRIPEADPWFLPEEPFGVYEEGVQSDSMSPWVFRVAEGSIDERILAYIVEADFTKHGVPEREARRRALELAQGAAREAQQQEQQAAQAEEATHLLKTMLRRGSARHRIDGESVIMDADGPRSTRTYIL